MPRRLRGDVEILAPKADQRWRLRASALTQIETDDRSDLFSLSRRSQVQLNDQVGARAQMPGQVVREDGRELTWRPAQEVTVGKVGRARNHALVTRRRIGLIEPPGSGRRIDADVRMVHGAAARPKLQAADEAAGRDGHGDDEIAEHVRTVGAKHVLRQGQDEVRLTVLPTIRFRRRPRVSACTLRHATRHPALDGGDFVSGHSTDAPKVSEPINGFPRRHVAARGGRHNHRRPTADLVERGEAEGRITAGLVTRDAPRPDDWRDVIGKCHRARTALGRDERHHQRRSRHQREGQPAHRREYEPKTLNFELN